MKKSDSQIFYIYKKASYVFPPRTKIFIADGKLFVEIGGKLTSNISKFLLAPAPKSKTLSKISPTETFKIGLPISYAGSQLADVYMPIANFCRKNAKLSYLGFDYATSHELALYTFFKSANAARSRIIMQEIQKTMPFLVNIFKRPLIHLKETYATLPVDAVKRVNHNTLRNLARHTENWKDVQNGNIVPSKLLTKIYNDDYKIYENVVFRNLIDDLLFFLLKRIYSFSETLDIFKGQLNMGGTSRLNHPNYFLAIGKLYSGFIKSDDTSQISEMLENAKYLYHLLNSRTNSLVYTKNANARRIAGSLKRTNILTMHKDYRHVFKLYNSFKEATFESKQRGDYQSQLEGQKNYQMFCQMLLLFAAFNFGAICKPNVIVYRNGKVKASLNLNGWRLVASSVASPIIDIDMLEVCVTKNSKTFKILLIPMGFLNFGADGKKQLENIVLQLFNSGSKFDKYIFLDPFNFSDPELYSYNTRLPIKKNFTLFYGVLPISISDINSFRRIQKLIFEALIQCDSEDTTCAFCGAETKGLCKRCMTIIKKVTCTNCNKEFIATFLDTKSVRLKQDNDESFFKKIPNFFKDEKLFFFRNIVKIDETDFYCPHCGQGNKRLTGGNK